MRYLHTVTADLLRRAAVQRAHTLMRQLKPQRVRGSAAAAPVRHTIGGGSTIQTTNPAAMGYPDLNFYHYQGITVGSFNVPGSNNNVAAPLTADGTADETCMWFSSDVQKTGKPASSSPGYNCQKNSFRSCQDCIDATNEFIARDAANTAFLKQDMTSPDSTSATFGTLAFPYPSVSGGQYATDGYENFVNALHDEVAAYPGQVLLVHGDSHEFVNQSGEMGLPNFKRVMNPGEAQVNWVKVTVDASAGTAADNYSGLFSVAQQVPNPMLHAESCES
ncbi:hypothetical protein JKP88DRAFT_252372 [Tribonema minus]|uniref:Uncharacterized protein n=1 Tax=Tribonema minus TaxID=303371 RepID=A0A835ZDL1_9STRA|nr:hypothetical protein JKP88DRAFT_252372 [Tribonema minus]